MVYVYTFLTLVGIAFSIGGFFASRMLSVAFLGVQEPVGFTDIAGFVVIIPELIFLCYFFMLKKQSLTWLYISVGLNCIIQLIDFDLLTSFGTIFYGWLLWRYIRNKKADGMPVFT